MADVTSKREALTIDSPPGDIWADFRQIEIITLHFAQDYAHSLGKTSRFFLELEHGRLFGTRCPSCERVVLPPRPLCPHCTQVTVWQELPLTGTVQTFSVMHFGSEINRDAAGLPTPYILAYVQIDGASTLMAHILRASPDSVTIGMRVRVAFTDQPVEHPIHLMHFVPLEA